MDSQIIQRPFNPESIQADVINLIVEQRLARLVEGGKFFKYTPKGQKIKDKFWICKLSPTHRILHYGDIDDSNKEPSFDELPNEILVSDISKLLIGKDCPHTKDGHMKKLSIDLAFTIVHSSDHEDYLNFVAIDQKTFCHWTDGLNALLNSTMVSEEYQKDLQILSKVEFKIRSMTNNNVCNK